MTTKTKERKTAEQTIEEKEKRIMDAISLRIPDRVPIICGMGYFPAKYAGIPSSAAYYDFPAWYAAYKKTLKDFPADMIYSQNFNPGKALEILEPKQLRWPGYGVDPYKGHQSIEVENMTADEYDIYMDDPADYKLRVNLSRASERLAGLSKLPRLSELGFGQMGAQMMARAMALPEVEEAVKTLIKAGKEFKKYQKQTEKFNQMMLDMGFPQYFQWAVLPPYDIVSHSIRGMAGTMMDMFRQPDKLIEMCEHLNEMSMARPTPKPNKYGHIRVFMTNTRGSDDFMSNEQFDKFYWPTMKKLINNLIERGMTPCMFFEGNFTSKLEYLLELPKGKMLARLDRTDIYRAKEILKDHMCIQGNVPSSLLQTGTVEDVKSYCKDLIDKIGKDGGFILSPRSSTDEVKPENLKAMIDFTHEYGVYN